MSNQLPPERCRLRFHLLFIAGLVVIIVVSSLLPLAGAR